MNDLFGINMPINFSLGSISGSSPGSDYNVAIKDVEIGDPGIGLNLTLTAKSGSAKAVSRAVVSLTYTDPSSGRSGWMEADISRKTIQGGNQPMDISYPFKLIFPFVDPQFGQVSIQGFSIIVSVDITYTDNSQSQISLPIPPGSQIISNTRFTYGISSSMITPQNSDTRLSGSNYIEISNVVAGDDAVGFTVDWTPDLDHRIGNFWAQVELNPASDGSAEGYVKMNLGGGTAEGLVHRPTEIILPFPRLQPATQGEFRNYYVGIFRVAPAGNPNESLPVTIGGENNVRKSSQTTELMQYSL